MRRSRARRDRGSALVLVTIVGVMLLVLVAVLVDSSLSASRGASGSHHHTAAHFTAMSGLWAGCNALSEGRSGDTSGTVGAGTWSPIASGDDLDNDGFVDFSSRDTFLALGDGYFESRAQLLGSSAYVVRARGVHGGVLRTIQAVAAPTGYTAAKPFSRALFAGGDLAAGAGTTLDSFDSTAGSWASHATTGTDIGGRLIKDRDASLGANGNIDLSGATGVYGDARPGPTGTISIVGSATVTGSTAALAVAEVHAPPLWTTPPASDPQVNLTALGVAYGASFSAASGTTALPPGKYVLSSLQLSGTAAIDITGSSTDVVEIYITGGGTAAAAPSLALAGTSQLRVAADGPTVKIYNLGKLDVQSGAGLNPTGTAPAQLQYFSPYSSDNASDVGVRLAGVDTAAVLYAPQANVELGLTGTVWGSAVGRHVSLTGSSAFHYDEALKDLTLPGAGKTLFAPSAIHELQ